MASPLSRPTIELLEDARRTLGEAQFNALINVKGYRTLRDIPNDSIAADILAWLLPSLELERRQAT
jgi:hypothetical protein